MATSGGFTQYEPSTRNKVAMVYAAHEGVYVSAVFDAVELTGLRREQMADLLHISMKTLLRHQQENKKLSPANSEWVLKLIALFQQGKAVFGNVAAFRSWLSKPAFGLGNQVPYELLATVGGMDLITDELTRIEYGDLA